MDGLVNSRQLRAAEYFWLPVSLLAIYAGLRLLGLQPSTDLVGMSAVLRVGFIVSAAAIAYLMTLLPRPTAFEDHAAGRFWTSTCLLLVLIAADDAFMIHETVAWHLQIPDALVMGLYGLLLVGLVLSHRHRLTSTFLLFLAGFVVLSGIAVAADTLSGREGVIWVLGRGIDYEQICETVACLLLASAFWQQALSELRPLSGR